MRGGWRTGWAGPPHSLRAGWCLSEASPPISLSSVGTVGVWVARGCGRDSTWRHVMNAGHACSEKGWYGVWACGLRSVRNARVWARKAPVAASGAGKGVQEWARLGTWMPQGPGRAWGYDGDF